MMVDGLADEPVMVGLHLDLLKRRIDRRPTVPLLVGDLAGNVARWRAGRGVRGADAGADPTRPVRIVPPWTTAHLRPR